MAQGWSGERVRLVALDERHFENALRWINDTEINAWLAVGDYPISRLAEREWFDGIQRAGQDAAHFAIENFEGEHVGFTSIFQIDFVNRNANSGAMIGSEFWGNGYGSDQARVRARFAFEVLGLEMLYSNYFEGNERSARMFAAAGYEIWGVQPKAVWKRGAFRSRVCVSLSRERWESLTNPH